jgi:DNA-binding transcriptional regulator YdaS (Cro superfamily)
MLEWFSVKTSDAIKHFGSIRALADVLTITPQAVYQWGDVVPAGRDFQIEVITNGALKASEASDGVPEQTRAAA